ncbi:MAG: hypothetical protein QXO15_00200 [Nitrososphaerota archaeon]
MARTIVVVFTEDCHSCCSDCPLRRKFGELKLNCSDLKIAPPKSWGDEQAELFKKLYRVKWVGDIPEDEGDKILKSSQTAPCRPMLLIAKEKGGGHA